MASTNVIEMSHHSVKWDDKKIQLLKNTVCKNSTNDELELFLHACNRLGLDPFMKQIHAVKRPTYNSYTKSQEWVMTIQTGIDGYRLIAERTGKYSPGKAPTYVYNENGTLVSSTAYIKKMTADGVWHEISAEAFYAEYVGTKKDGSPNTIWATKPHIMLSKCAEALALRKAFPSELSGVYTKEEMDQADNPSEEKYEEVSNDNKITPAELQLVANYTKKLPMEKVHAFLDHYNIKKVQDLAANDLEGALKKLKLTLEAFNESNQS